MYIQISSIIDTKCIFFLLSLYTVSFSIFHDATVYDRPLFSLLYPLSLFKLLRDSATIKMDSKDLSIFLIVLFFTLYLTTPSSLSTTIFTFELPFPLLTCLHISLQSPHRMISHSRLAIYWQFISSNIAFTMQNISLSPLLQYVFPLVSPTLVMRPPLIESNKPKVLLPPPTAQLWHLITPNWALDVVPIAYNETSFLFLQQLIFHQLWTSFLLLPGCYSQYLILYSQYLNLAFNTKYLVRICHFNSFLQLT